MTISRIDLQFAELLGFLKGILCDGMIVDGEAKSLRAWFMSNPEVLDGPPMDAVGVRLVSMLADGRLDGPGCAELQLLLAEIVAVLEIRDRAGDVAVQVHLSHHTAYTQRT